MSLIICRGHIRASKGTFQIFLWLTVLWQIDILEHVHSFQVSIRMVDHWQVLVYMCAGGFRGHKSLNRIELS